MRRRAGESFLLGPDIELQILEVTHTRVSIGITAPEAVAIVRKEVVLTRDENLTAAQSMPEGTIAWIGECLRARRQLDGPSKP
jgi:carbon storage regulator CsrA